MVPLNYEFITEKVKGGRTAWVQSPLDFFLQLKLIAAHLQEAQSQMAYLLVRRLKAAGRLSNGCLTPKAKEISFCSSQGVAVSTRLQILPN